MYIQGKNAGLGGLGDIDWNSIIKDVVGGYAAVKTAQTQASLTKQQLQLQQQQQNAAIYAQNAALQYQLNPQYSGTYGGAIPQSSNMMPLILIGGGALLLLMLIKG